MSIATHIEHRTEYDTHVQGTRSNANTKASSNIDYLLKYDADDMGNALTMKEIYSDMFLYSPALGWLQYIGTHYKQVYEETIMKFAANTLRQRRHAAIDAKNETLVKATKQSASNVRACVQMFRTLVVVSEVSQFDSDPDVLNCRNGVVDLRTGSVTPHASSQRFTYCLLLEYKSDANTSLWDTFIRDAIGDDLIVRYLQACVGYSLTGHTREEKLFYLYGPPRAGKGTFTETFLAILQRPLSNEIDFNSFTARRDADSQNFDLAGLKSTRFLVASESNRYQSLNPAKVKQITGGNWIRCSFKHKDMFEYRPQFKVWLVSNHPVNADAEDDALWGRVQIFNFPHSHFGQEDTTLKSRIALPENLTGVLKWAVDGAMQWYQDGLKPPQAILDATQKQRDQQDYIKQWLEECCRLDDSAYASSKELLESYQAWCKDNNIKPERSQDVLGSLVKRFSCSRVRKRSNVKGYTGIALCYAGTLFADSDTATPTKIVGATEAYIIEDVKGSAPTLPANTEDNQQCAICGVDVDDATYDFRYTPSGVLYCQEHYETWEASQQESQHVDDTRYEL